MTECVALVVLHKSGFTFTGIIQVYSRNHTVILPKMMSSEHEKPKAAHCAYLNKVFKNVIFLARQGLSFRGNWESTEKEGKEGSEVKGGL